MLVLRTLHPLPVILLVVTLRVAHGSVQPPFGHNSSLPMSWTINQVPLDAQKSRTFNGSHPTSQDDLEHAICPKHERNESVGLEQGA